MFIYTMWELLCHFKLRFLSNQLQINQPQKSEIQMLQNSKHTSTTSGKFYSLSHVTDCSQNAGRPKLLCKITFGVCVYEV